MMFYKIYKSDGSLMGTSYSYKEAEDMLWESYFKSDLYKKHSVDERCTAYGTLRLWWYIKDIGCIRDSWKEN